MAVARDMRALVENENAVTSGLRQLTRHDRTGETCARNPDSLLH